MKLFAGCKSFEQAEWRLRQFLDDEMLKQIPDGADPDVYLPNIANEIDQLTPSIMKMLRGALPHVPETL